MISTHKMLAASGKENTAQITDQASTLSGNTKAFFDCNESYPVTATVDVVGGALTIDNVTGGNTVGDGSEDGVNVSILSTPDGEHITGGNWPDPGTDDYIMLVCGKSVDAGNDVDDNGAISFYFGERGNGAMRVQPYYASFMDDTDLDCLWKADLATPYCETYQRRTVGADYMFAGVKRGNYMEHYAEGAMTGRVDIVSHADGFLADKWLNQVNRGAIFQCGHSSYGKRRLCTQQFIDFCACLVLGEPLNGSFEPIPPNTGSIIDYPQDFYGFVVHVFPNGMPSQSEIENGMKWMKPRWLAGDKVIYPGWMF